LLERLIAIGDEAEQATTNTGIMLTVDLGTDYQRMMDYVAGVQRDDPDWSWPGGMNCHNFCSGAAAAGGGNGPRVTIRLTRNNVGNVVRAIVTLYESEREEEDDEQTGTRLPRHN
jgi:hypothetical protein